MKVVYRDDHVDTSALIAILGREPDARALILERR
jgi:hypothetical protein